ncbi:MAG TPA: CHAT domain-containing protein [Acidobacteriota bacterium]|jgi:CHAT domain-containing protein
MSGRNDGDPIAALLDQYSGLSDRKSLNAFLSRHAQLIHPASVERLTEAVRENLRKDLARALNLAEGALVLAERLDDNLALAHSLRAKANVLWFMNQNEAAAEMHERAYGLFQEAGNSTEAARTLSSSIQPLILLGQYDRALKAVEKARQIFSDLGDDRRIARLEINLANIFHRQDRFGEALAVYERAYQQLLLFKDAEGIGVALHNMAVCLISLNDFQTALTTYQRAREFCRQHAMPGLVAQADYNIAYLHYLRGEYSRALEMLRATREACQKAGDLYHTALCNLDQSEIYLELNLSEEAAEMAQQAVQEFRHLGMRYETAKALSNLAIAFGQQGKAFRALELFNQAKLMFVSERNDVWPSLIDLYQALVLYSEGRLFEARRLCASALDFFRKSALRSKEVLCRLLLARLALRSGDLQSARRECEQSLELLAHMETPSLSYQAHFLAGQIREAAAETAEAYNSYQEARRSLEMIRSVLRGEELKIAFMKNRLEVYERLVQLCMAGDSNPASAQEAFGYIEESKSRSLRDLIFERAQSLPVADLGHSQLVRQIRELREELNWYYHRIELEQLRQEDRSPARIERLQAQLQARENEFVRVLREIPQLESSADLYSAPVETLESVRSALGGDAMLIEYFRVGDRIVVALLSHEELEVIPLTPVSRVRKILQMLQFQLAKFRLGPYYVTAFQDSLLQATQSHLRDLYRELVAPLRDRLQAHHLVFVPHDLLHYVPFHALFDGWRYLIDAFTISYAPSASIYTLCHRRSATSSSGSLILGVPDPQTPFIEQEIQSVAAILPSPELFVGVNATEDVLRKRGPLSRLVHIATHGFFREDNPMFSGVRLGTSYLSLYDLYHLRLPVELVTLSGCATGLNVVAAGDELLGLVRGLLYAGAQTLLLTLWEVHDRSTADFMASFYRRLQQQGSKALALQGAMMELRDQSPHPYFWAPFELVGKVF